MGILDRTPQERSLRKSKLTLDKTIEFCRAVESSKGQSKVLQDECAADEVKVKRVFTYAPRQCPAWGKTCAKMPRSLPF